MKPRARQAPPARPRLAPPPPAAPPTPAAMPRLTLREQQVLTCVLRGDMDKTVCDELHLSRSRVRKILSSLFAKFGAPSRVHLILAWLRCTGAVDFWTHSAPSAGE